MDLVYILAGVFISAILIALYLGHVNGTFA